MDTLPTIPDFLIQTLGLLVFGVVVYFLTRWLKFKYESWNFKNPGQSALIALGVTVLPMMTIMIFALSRASNGAGTYVDVEVRHSPSSVVSQLIVYILLFSPVFIAMKVRNESWKSAGVTGTNLGKSVLVGFILGMLAIVTCDTCVQGIVTGLKISHFWAFLHFSVVGFGEEFGYRGYLQTRLIAWVGRWQGWLLTSILMAMVHVSGRLLVGGLDVLSALLSSAMLITISLLMGYIMLRTENFVAPAFLHTVADWVNVFM